jgi:hypothetical protein
MRKGQLDMRTKLRDMRTKLRGKISLLFVVCAVFVAIPAVAALADVVQTNDVVAGNNATKAPGGTGTASVYLDTTDPADTVNGCNATGSTPATITLTSSSSNLTFPNGSSKPIVGCGTANTVSIDYKVSSSTPDGQVITVTGNATGGKSGADYTADTFTVTVKSPDSTPPVISKVVTGTLNNGWYTSNVGVDWTVSDSPSAISSQSGCTDFSVTSDQQATTYTCSAASAGGTSSDSVTIKRDATQPTNVQFVGGPNASGSYTFGNVPNEPTCTADDATSTIDTCVVSGYSNAVGTHTLTATATDKAGNKTTATRTYTVNKADPTITWNAPAAIDYGTALNATQLNATANVDGTFAYTPETGSVLNAGTHTLSVQFTPNDTTSYNSASKSVSLTVNKVDATINVNGYTGVYDGNAHGATGTATGVNNENLSNLLHLGASFTNAPGGTANWSFSGNTNYNSDSGTAAIVINKADTTTTVSCDAGPFTYTGSAQTPCSASVSGPGSLNQAVTPVTYTDNTNAGTATASATYAGTANYNGSSDSENFTIGKADTTTKVTCPTSVTYTGSAHTPCSASVSGAGGLNQSLTVNYTNNTNAGTATASASYAGTTNYGASSDSTTFTIDKATAQVTLSGLGPYFYDGTPKAATATTSNPAGLNVSITYNGSTTAPTNVGSYNVVATVDNPNYQGQATGTLVIKPWTLNGFYQPIDMGDVLNTVKNGSTVPVKFELFSGTTELTSTSAVSSISAKQVNCAAFNGDPVDEIEYLAPTGGTSLRYDATAGQFIYNWATPKKANTCYSLTMTATDGSTLTAYFKLR